MNLAYDNIKATGLFNVQWRVWWKKATADKTYDKRIEFFTEAETDRNQNETTSGAAGDSVHEVRADVREEFKTMLAEEAHDPTTTLTHNDIESFLSGASTATETAVEQANAVTKSDLESLWQKLIDYQNNNGNDNRNRNRNRNRDRDRDRDCDQPIAQGIDDDGKPITYCWSHGITHNLKHHSCSCRRKKEGHKDAAALHNRMGGSNEIRKPTCGNWNNRDRNTNNWKGGSIELHTKVRHKVKNQNSALQSYLLSNSMSAP